MTLFHLDWFRCLDGYRFDQTRGDGRVIVPNSARWEATEPLKIPGAYRQFADWDGSDDGLLKLYNAFGFLDRPKAKAERVEGAKEWIALFALLVAIIDSEAWETLTDWLGQASQYRAGGIGRLSLHLDVSADRPVLKLRPASLTDAIQVQALADASLGIHHRKCKNPECDQYFPISGLDAYRSDAEYHSVPCRLRHAYLIKKATTKKERRS